MTDHHLQQHHHDDAHSHSGKGKANDQSARLDHRIDAFLDRELDATGEAALLRDVLRSQPHLDRLTREQSIVEGLRGDRQRLASSTRAEETAMAVMARLGFEAPDYFGAPMRAAVADAREAATLERRAQRRDRRRGFLFVNARRIGLAAAIGVAAGAGLWFLSEPNPAPRRSIAEYPIRPIDSLVESFAEDVDPSRVVADRVFNAVERVAAFVEQEGATFTSALAGGTPRRLAEAEQPFDDRRGMASDSADRARGESSADRAPVLAEMLPATGDSATGGSASDPDDPVDLTRPDRSPGSSEQDAAPAESGREHQLTRPHELPTFSADPSPLPERPFRVDGDRSMPAPVPGRAPTPIRESDQHPEDDFLPGGQSVMLMTAPMVSPSPAAIMTSGGRVTMPGIPLVGSRGRGTAPTRPNDSIRYDRRPGPGALVASTSARPQPGSVPPRNSAESASPAPRQEAEGPAELPVAAPMAAGSGSASPQAAGNSPPPSIPAGGIAKPPAGGASPSLP